MPSPEVPRVSELTLLAWDWRRTLREADRSPAWLARVTGTHYRAVYRYWHGQLEAPIAFRRAAWAALEHEIDRRGLPS